MSMSKKDFEAVASALAAFSTISAQAPVKDVVAEVAEVLALKLQASNPAFNKAMFLAACKKEVAK